jgi:hypothetical protein
VKAEYDGQRVVTAGERLDSAVRESRPTAGSPSVTNGSAPPGAKEKTLDDWLAESEGEDEDSDEEEGESEEGAEETDEESSEEESEAEEDESDDDMEHDRLVK